MADDIDWDAIDKRVVAYTKGAEQKILKNERRSEDNEEEISEQADDLRMIKRELTQLVERVERLEELNNVKVE